MSEEKRAAQEIEEAPRAGLPSRRAFWPGRLPYFFLGAAIVCIGGLAFLALRRVVSPPAEETAGSAATSTRTPTSSPTPTATATPRPPTATPTPAPTLTPLPPVRHKVHPGQTWIGLAIWYDVSLDSILTLNGRTEADLLKADEEVLIPLPTYTPTPEVTLVPTLELMEEYGPDQCREHIIVAGETLIAVALEYEMTVQLIQSVNNITNPDLVKEGQRLCIPLVTPGPPPSPTFGPTPTPEERAPHSAPHLLYPPAGVEVPPGSAQVTLQWTVVGFLDPDEYYMVEVRSVSRPDARAVRGLVKTTTWRLPESMQPAVGSIETYAWRVSVVRGKGDPASDGFVWERSGFPASWQRFLWLGVAPESTPTPTG